MTETGHAETTPWNTKGQQRLKKELISAKGKITCDTPEGTTNGKAREKHTRFPIPDASKWSAEDAGNFLSAPSQPCWGVIAAPVYRALARGSATHLKSDLSEQRIRNLHARLQLTTGAHAMRFLTPVPGKKTVGIELPNREADTVTLRKLLAERGRDKSSGMLRLPIALGKDVEGKVHFANLATLPHLLVAGCFGSGKSDFLHSALLSLLMQLRPEELRLILIAPTGQDLRPYAALPHLTCPLPTTAAGFLRVSRRVAEEMNRRFCLFGHAGVRNMEDYNRLRLERLPRWCHAAMS